MPRLPLGLRLILALIAFGWSANAAPVDAQDADALPTIEETVEGMESFDGFLPFWWDEAEGKVWLEIDRFGEDLLYYTSLPTGVGSNDIGLNRGDLIDFGSPKVVQFERIGRKVLMKEENWGFRATDTDNPLEVKSVEDAFAPSVVWGFTVAARTGDRVLVDATPLLFRDAHGVIDTFRRLNQGSYRLDESRSAIYLERTRNFPENSEFEVTLTFTSDNPGGLVASVAADASAVTVRQHHSFVMLPPQDDFEMRRADPRAGYFGPSYMDFTVPIGEDMTQRFIAKHRLEKVDPSAEVSEAVEPIVYYLDPGTPEPVATALIEGGEWWNQAFEAIGYRNAFRVERLPAEADPMDARYNVIQWVHRSTRGWSYGSTITDPRTGEILKGHVSLGSLRVRQDYLLFEGLLSPYADGDEPPPEILAAALDRIRQLSAHEIGHTLGLAHNYIASAQGPDLRASVMDYPHPLVRLENGEIVLDDAYDLGIGEWDKVAIAYGYQDFPEGTDVAAALDSIITEAIDRNITFISDQDARPAGSAHPEVHLWDNGAVAANELNRMMNVRRHALDAFGLASIRSGRPLATMEETLVPLFLHHRYQVEAAAKVVGGQGYTYALKGDGQPPLTPVSGNAQRTALRVLMRTIRPDELAIPEAVRDQLPPRPFLYGPNRELFPKWTSPTFDAISPAAVAADLTLSMVLHPVRAARLVQQHAMDDDLPGLFEVLDEVRASTFEVDHDEGYLAEVSRVVERITAERMMQLAATAPMPQVRAITTMRLEGLRSWLEGRSGGSEAEQAHRALLAADLARFLDRDYGEGPQAPGMPDAPPGSPIGGGGAGAQGLGSGAHLGSGGWSLSPIAGPGADSVTGISLFAGSTSGWDWVARYAWCSTGG